MTSIRERIRSGRPLMAPWMIAVSVIAVLAVFVAVLSAVAARSPGRKAGSAASSSGSSGDGTRTATGTGDKADTGKGGPTQVFARLKKYGVDVHLPASRQEMLAVGYHQSWNANGTDMAPVLTVHGKDKYAGTQKALKSDPDLKLFLMMSRGRGSSEYTAADCAVKPGSTILAPVTGTVTLVTTYHLAGYGKDYRVEIKADGAAGIRVVLIHIRDPKVKVGQRVSGGVTPLATVRHLTIDSQVNRYLPWPADHTHVQVNAVGYKLNSGS